MPHKPKIVIYTADYCSFCHAAKELLRSRGLEFQDIDVTNDDAEREKLAQRTGGRETVPQIFIDGKSIGGYRELVELDKKGGLGR